MRCSVLAGSLLLVVATAVRAADKAEIHWDRGTGRVEVRGLSNSQLRQAEQQAQTAGWTGVWSISVDRDGVNRIAVLGEYSVADNALRFEPRFPWAPGLTYRVRYGEVTETFTVPAKPPSPPTRVTQVYPTANILPENQLKLYVHFSAPMSQGDSYRFVRLFDAKGHEVELPFLELGQELWNPEGTRLTLLFDPGRIKQGLKPREDAGPALESGRKYTLVIDRKWSDAEGRELAAEHRKAFRVGPPDETQPDPRQWKVAEPTADSREPLGVDFGEPLDHALLERVVSVQDPSGRNVPGQVVIDRQETRWQFRPEQPWNAGEYYLVADTVLEDLAGNSIGRPFEVDVLRRVERQVVKETVSRPFRVRPSKPKP